MAVPSLVSGSEGPAVSLWKVHVVMAMVQVGYAAGDVLSKVALTVGVNAIVFATYRGVIAISAMAPVAYFVERGKRGRLDLTTISLLVLLGLIGTFGSELLLMFGLKLATASLSCVVPITIPVCVFLISAVFGLEDINWRRLDGQAKVGGFMCAIVGGVVVVIYKGPAILGALPPGLHNTPGSDVNGTSQYTMLDLGIETWQIGVILLFLSGVALAILITLQVPVLKRYPAPISMATFTYFFGVLAFAILALVTVRDSSEWVIYNQPSTIISVFYVGVISSGANFALQTWALQRAGPLLIATYNSLQPFVTNTLAHIFLGESIHLGSVSGTLVIISGLYLITWGKMNGRKVSSLPKEAVPAPNGAPPINATSSLEEPLLP